MKQKIFYLLSFITLGLAGCSKKFLDEMKSYDKYDESIFENETQTGWYIDRLYNYYFAAYKSPVQTLVGSQSDDKYKMTEEVGGTVGDYINPTKTLSLASEASSYYGSALGTSYANVPYTRIRMSNFLIEKIDASGTGLSQTFRERAKGQMYFLRALQYFDLVRTYGGVPIVTVVTDGSPTDETIRIPRATSTECFAQIVKDLDSAAKLLPMIWDVPTTNYGRATAAGALAMKSRVLLTAASPLFNSDWDNSGSDRWQKALDAGLTAETQLTTAGYGLFGSSAKDWGEMTTRNNNAFNKEALVVQLLASGSSTTVINNSWENGIRPTDHNGGGGISVPKGMLDLFPMADGSRPTAANGYVDTFFFENRDPRFYRTFAFSGAKWPIKTNSNKVSWFYRWKNAKGTVTYAGNNQTNSPAVVRKMSDPAADTTALAFSGTDIFEYRYAELLLNIAECYAAKGDVANCILYLGKIRQRVGIPSANNYGIGTLSNKYAAIEACLYERRVELAYEGKRFWDIQRWMLYDNIAEAGNTCSKLGLTPINGTNRKGYYWQPKTTYESDPVTAAERTIAIDPDASDFTTQVANLKKLVRDRFVITTLDQALDRVNSTEVTILFRSNYYISGLHSTLLGNNPWLSQTTGWKDASGAAGTFTYR